MHACTCNILCIVCAFMCGSKIKMNSVKQDIALPVGQNTADVMVDFEGGQVAMTM